MTSNVAYERSFAELSNGHGFSMVKVITLAKIIKTICSVFFLATVRILGLVLNERHFNIDCTTSLNQGNFEHLKTFLIIFVKPHQGFDCNFQKAQSKQSQIVRNFQIFKEI